MGMLGCVMSECGGMFCCYLRGKGNDFDSKVEMSKGQSHLRDLRNTAYLGGGSRKTQSHG